MERTNVKCIINLENFQMKLKEITSFAALPNNLLTFSERRSLLEEFMAFFIEDFNETRKTEYFEYGFHCNFMNKWLFYFKV